ncbi:MAG TPA: ribonuclease D [Thiothrix sp.]|nr:ribonuclease D [Thiothrix sp.]
MYEYIDTTDKLQHFINRISTASWVALDTEFIRGRHYFSRLCLIQIATEDHIGCIDPLACKDLSAFASILYNKKITKVLHAVHQDIDIFYQLFKQIPTPIFDSQTAAAVLGIGHQIGYSNLVLALLGIELDKSQSRTDWAKRPLSSKQLDYAIDDVRYLREIYPLLLTQLQQLNRLDWLIPSAEHSTALSTYQPQPEAMWKKVHGKQTLNGQQLAVLRELAAWREITAIKRNLPRRWLTPDPLLIDLAKRQPNTTHLIQRLHHANTKQLQPYHKQWLSCIKKAKNTPSEQWPIPKTYQKPSKSQIKLIDLLQLAVRYHANKHNISPILIANRKTIESMVIEGRNTLANDWRGALVNKSFAAIIAGKAHISINQQGDVNLSYK